MTTTRVDFEQCFHPEIPANTNKEVMRMLKKESEILKEEKNKLNYNTSEKEMFINSSTRKLNEEMDKQMQQRDNRKTEKHPSWQKILDSRNQFSSVQNTYDELLHKIVKNDKENEISQHRHEISICIKQNCQSNPIINSLPENLLDISFWKQKTVP